MKIIKGLGLLAGLYLIVFFSVLSSSEKISVNYSLPVSNVIAAADIHSVVPVRRYREEETGKKIIRVKLFRFEFPNNIYQISEVEREMALVNYRPADLEELIQYAKNHRNVDESIVALGSSSINPDGFQKWPFLRLAVDGRHRYELAEIVEERGTISTDNQTSLTFLAVEK